MMTDVSKTAIESMIAFAATAYQWTVQPKLCQCVMVISMHAYTRDCEKNIVDEVR